MRIFSKDFFRLKDMVGYFQLDGENVTLYNIDGVFVATTMDDYYFYLLTEKPIDFNTEITFYKMTEPDISTGALTLQYILNEYTKLEEYDVDGVLCKLFVRATPYHVDTIMVCEEEGWYAYQSDNTSKTNVHITKTYVIKFRFMVINKEGKS